MDFSLKDITLLSKQKRASGTPRVRLNESCRSPHEMRKRTLDDTETELNATSCHSQMCGMPPLLPPAQKQRADKSGGKSEQDAGSSRLERQPTVVGKRRSVRVREESVTPFYYERSLTRANESDNSCAKSCKSKDYPYEYIRKLKKDEPLVFEEGSFSDLPTAVDTGINQTYSKRQYIVENDLNKSVQKQLEDLRRIRDELNDLSGRTCSTSCNEPGDNHVEISRYQDSNEIIILPQLYPLQPSKPAEDEELSFSPRHTSSRIEFHWKLRPSTSVSYISEESPPKQPSLDLEPPPSKEPPCVEIRERSALIPPDYKSLTVPLPGSERNEIRAFINHKKCALVRITRLQISKMKGLFQRTEHSKSLCLPQPEGQTILITTQEESIQGSLQQIVPSISIQDEIVSFKTSFLNSLKKLYTWIQSYPYLIVQILIFFIIFWLFMAYIVLLSSIYCSNRNFGVSDAFWFAHLPGLHRAKPSVIPV